MSETSEVRERPLSPHLQVYRLPYNAKMSISGRAVGVALCFTLILLLGWLSAVVWKPELYDQSMTFLEAPYIKYIALFWAFLVFFYLGNGVRHVLWSMGVGVNEKSGIMSGNIVLVLSALMTFGLWQFSCGCWSKDHEAAPMTEEVKAQQEQTEGAE